MINRVTEYLPEQRTRAPADPKAPGTPGSVQEWVEPVQDIIVKYPSATLATAFVIGVAVAWWIKRT